MSPSPSPLSLALTAPGVCGCGCVCVCGCVGVRRVCVDVCDVCMRVQDIHVHVHIMYVYGPRLSLDLQMVFMHAYQILFLSPFLTKKAWAIIDDNKLLYMYTYMDAKITCTVFSVTITTTN